MKLSYVAGDSNDQNNSSTQIVINYYISFKVCKAFANGSSANINLSKTQLQQIWKKGQFLCRLLRPLLKTGLPFEKNVLKSLPKSILITFRLSALATDGAIHKKMFESGMTTLMISNKEMNEIMKLLVE